MTDFLEDSPFASRIRDGREFPIAVCTCPQCKAEFYVADLGGTEWHPNFCCYCGVKYPGAKVFQVEITPAEPVDPPEHECSGK